MATFTVGSDPRFPTGTNLSCYPVSGGGIPSGASVTGSTVSSDGSCTFTGLEASTRYGAGTTPAGPFVFFRTEGSTDTPGTPGTPADGSLTYAQLSDPLKALLVAGRPHDGANYPERVEGVAFNHWVGPSEPPDFENGDVWTPTT